MSLSSPIQLGDNDAVRWCKLQRFVRLMADNAGISYNMSGFLTDINVGDNIAVRWAKLGTWMGLVAENITSGGGGTGNVRSGTVALAQNDVSKAVVFSSAFTGAGLPDIVGTIMAPNGGDVISVEPDYSTLTNSGVTFIIAGGVPAAGYHLSFVANK